MKNISNAIDAAVCDLVAEDMVSDNTIIQTPEPDPSRETVLAIVEALKDVGASGGYLKIARANGVSTGTVRMVMRAISARLRVLNSDVGELGELPKAG